MKTTLQFDLMTHTFYTQELQLGMSYDILEARLLLEKNHGFAIMEAIEGKRHNKQYIANFWEI